MLNFRDGDNFTFKLPDGTEGHVKLVKITDRTARLAFAIPETMRVTRDTLGAARTFEELKT